MFVSVAAVIFVWVDRPGLTLNISIPINLVHNSVGVAIVVNVVVTDSVHIPGFMVEAGVAPTMLVAVSILETWFDGRGTVSGGCYRCENQG